MMMMMMMITMYLIQFITSIKLLHVSAFLTTSCRTNAHNSLTRTPFAFALYGWSKFLKNATFRQPVLFSSSGKEVSNLVGPLDRDILRH